MALSGQILGASYNDYRIYLDWSATQNVAANTSTVTSWLYIQKVGPNSQTWNGGSATYAFNIGGQVSSGNTSFDLRSAAVWSTVLVSAFSTTITHDSIGDANCYFEAWLNAQGYTGTLAIGGQSVPLDRIPRASTITGVTGSVPLYSNVTVTVDKKSSGFTQVYRFGLNGIAWLYESLGTADASFTYQIPKSWANNIPNNVSWTGIVGVRTYNGGTQIGDEQYTYFTVTVPDTDEYKPSMTITPTRVDNTVPAGWGIYVQSKSSLKIDLSSILGAYSSTIASKSITIDGQTVTNANTSTILLNSSGTVSYSATLTDSRGRSKTYTGTITVVVYETPKVLSSLSQRCLSNATLSDTGAYLKILATGSFSSCSSKNTATMRVSYKKTTDSTYSTTSAITSGITSGAINAAFGVDYSYDIKVEIIDQFNTTPKMDFISGAKYPIHFKRGGDGVAFGKAATTPNLAEFEFGAQCNNGAVITNGLTLDYEKLNDISNSVNIFTTMNSVIGAMPDNSFKHFKIAATATDIGLPVANVVYLGTVHRYSSTYARVNIKRVSALYEYVCILNNGTWGTWLETSGKAESVFSKLAADTNFTLYDGGCYKEGNSIILNVLALKSSTLATSETAFTLDVSIRPVLGVVIYPNLRNSGSGAVQAGYGGVNTNGTVTCYVGNNISANTLVYNIKYSLG